MKIDHGNLRALAAVVREGSFERAAAALNVTPSAVSQRIKTLEARMGRLLVQRTVPVEATPDGRVLVQLAEQTALLEHDALDHLGLEDETRHASMAIAVNHDSLETWFVKATALFAAGTRTTLDLQSEDQDHTAALLRKGAVLGAVTTLADPVQGCRIHALGRMRYVATCSPEFHARYFSHGLNAASLTDAPVVLFNRKDALQPRFAQQFMNGLPWQPPAWWLPSARAFIQATLDGLGWSMNPLLMIQADLDAGRLVPLRTRAFEDVPLYWQHWRVESQTMELLTRSVLTAASGLIKKC